MRVLMSERWDIDVGVLTSGGWIHVGGCREGGHRCGGDVGEVAYRCGGCREGGG